MGHTHDSLFAVENRTILGNIVNSPATDTLAFCGLTIYGTNKSYYFKYCTKRILDFSFGLFGFGATLVPCVQVAHLQNAQGRYVQINEAKDNC